MHIWQFAVCAEGGTLRGYLWRHCSQCGRVERRMCAWEASTWEASSRSEPNDCETQIPQKPLRR